MKLNKLILIALASIVTSAFAQMPTNGLVARYSFNGNANDVSGNNLNGSVTNATLTTDRFGNNNSAYAFNGTSSYIRVEDNNVLDFSTAFTLCAWFKSNDSITPDQAIVGKTYVTNGGGYNLTHYAINGTTISVGFVNDPSVKGVYYPAGNYKSNWHFIVGTYDGQKIKLYMDGVLLDSTLTTLTIPASTQPLFIGRGMPSSSTPRFFNGLIDDVTLYNRAISQSEVNQLLNYQDSSNIVKNLPNGLVAWYPFNGNANDVSGNNLNGSVTNATLTADRFGNNNSAYTFDGTSSYIRVEDNNLLDFSTAFTLCAWFKSNDSITPDQAIVGKTFVTYGGGYNLTHYAINGTTISVGFVNDPNVRGVYYPAGNYKTNWHFIVGTYDGQKIKLYMDGVLLDSTLTTLTIPASTQPLFIGRGMPSSSTPRFFNGLIDDVSLYNKAISQTEVTQLYNYMQTCDITITSPLTNQHAFKGDSASFIVNATGTLLKYKWQVKNGTSYSDITDGCMYSGSNTNKLTVNTVTSRLNNNQYRCLTFNGLCKDSSATANLIIDSVVYDTIHITVVDTITTIDTIRITVTDTLLIDINTGLNDPNSTTNTIKVYPNPAKDMLTIDNGNFGSMAGYSVKLINMLGQTVFSSAINQQSLNVNLTTLSGEGVYYIQIIDPSDNIVDIRKIVLR
jgi:hypothetical protein